PGPAVARVGPGGKVTFNVDNDSPTLTGARVTFTIELQFPHTQTALPGGEVVWAQDGFHNGTKHVASEPVYPMESADWKAVFPDGTPINNDEKPNYVFVWKTWEGIDKVEIVQMENAVATSEMDKTCWTSHFPKEVCSVILDADCLRPLHSVCNMVEPSRECQLVLRHFFNTSTGVYCVNVSMANDVSLALTSAKFNLGAGNWDQNQLFIYISSFIYLSIYCMYLFMYFYIYSFCISTFIHLFIYVFLHFFIYVFLYFCVPVC
uniref:Premelanosome protein b n=1 Tax=Neogobius melanostomus TaxID=47308 RepID=A0A8C6S7X9_9GOBI